MCRLPHYCPVAAYQDWGLDGLVEMIWQYLRLLRIYTKPKVLSCAAASYRYEWLHCSVSFAPWYVTAFMLKEKHTLLYQTMRLPSCLPPQPMSTLRHHPEALLYCLQVHSQLILSASAEQAAGLQR